VLLKLEAKSTSSPGFGISDPSSSRRPLAAIRDLITQMFPPISSSWPPSGAAIQKKQIFQFSLLDGRVKPGHASGATIHCRFNGFISQREHLGNQDPGSQRTPTFATIPCLHSGAKRRYAHGMTILGWR
jgi:hypothetical protein